MTLASVLRAVSPSVLVLRPSATGRILFGAFAALMGAVMLLDRSLSVVPLALFLLATGGALFTDEWRFDSDARTAERRIGTILVARTVRYPIGPGARIGLATTRRGRARTPFQRLVLRADDGREAVLEMGRGDEDAGDASRERAGHRAGRGRLEEYARLIARHLDVELRLE